ncbi:Retrovirus-related Pol polyprotein from transposon TNT 1-94 [Vitis vinifera]|uniref:Retrovirus-related Pol polyprotein from transposon TNT 1-94 n=1 Tax=Vitis vinifera TaxID=29760 RepID=A0A438E7R5_VITVI|nr:Retrovirus-related Pol polyprotein from transposon TNT 1-94 [Vitis vinifera]
MHQTRKRTKKSNSKANLVEAEAEAEVITTVISSEVSMVTNMNWVVDSRATRHICGNRSAFTSYTTVKEGEEQVFLGDSKSTLVIGKGKVLLKITSGKVLALSDVLHVPDIRWNLVSVSLLGKVGVRILFDFDKIVLTENDAFVGKGYSSIHNLVIHQMDVKTAFLNGDLEEEIYMDQPEGYVVSGNEKKQVREYTSVVICLYVDDMLIFGTKPREHYVEKIQRKFEHFDCKPVSTPYDPSSQLKKSREHSVAQIEYAQIIGSLMYLMNCTILDIAYAVGRLNRYTQSPNQDHWTIVRRILKYLRGTINYGLCFSGFPSVLEGYSDANWISNSDEMKSTSGYVFILGESAVSWKSAKQICITRSTMEAEFIALEKASSEVEWLRNLLADIPLWMTPSSSVSMCCDSQAAIAKAKSKIFNGKNRHIHLRHNIVRQLLETGVISLEFVRSELNLADPLTKPLNKKLVEETSRGMGLMPITEVKSGGNPTY